jgi:Protein of unknown function (DUF3515)
VPGRPSLTEPAPAVPRRAPRAVLLAFLAGVLLIGAAAFGLHARPLPVDLTHPGPAAAAACAELSRRLPATVAGQGRRAVDPTSQRSAAWGADPVVLRCGVGAPAALAPTSELTTIDGVDWLPEQLDHGYRYTSVGRTAAVQVTVPDSYAPEADVLVDLSPAILAADSALPVATP